MRQQVGVAHGLLVSEALREVEPRHVERRGVEAVIVVGDVSHRRLPQL